MGQETTGSGTVSTKAQRAGGIGLATKLFYGIGSTAYGVKETGFRTLLLLFYNQVLGLPVGLVAMAIAIAMVVDAVIDPVIGQISDTWHSKWGRRHPFMYVSAIPTAIAFILLWNPPGHLSQSGLLIYLIVISIVVRVSITIYEIPSSALSAELSNNYDERTSLQAWRYLFFFFGGQLMSILMFRVFLRPDATHSVGQLNPAGYAKFGWVAGAVILLSILLSAIGTHRNIPYLHQPPAGPKRSLWAVLKEMYETWSNRSFLMVTLGGVFKSTALGVSGGLGLYFSTYFWELKASQIGFLVIDGMIGAYLAFQLVGPLTRRFGKRNTAVALLLGGIVISSAPVVLRLMGLFFANHSPYLVPFLFVQGSVFAAIGIGAQMTTSAMVADVVEDSELATGRRSEGLLFSAASMVQKAVTGVGALGAGLILSIVHFPEHAKPGHVDPVVLRNLALVYVPALAILFILSGLFTGLYRIDRNKHEQNLRLLEGHTEPDPIVP
jgi:Na+/melibiose symporter-like transporter